MLQRYAGGGFFCRPRALYVSDVANWAEAARAHGEAFSEIRPAFTLVNALPFLNPEILVEFELVAVRNE